jgi:hypothetical protein
VRSRAPSSSMLCCTASAITRSLPTFAASMACALGPWTFSSYSHPLSLCSLTSLRIPNVNWSVH